MINAMMNDTYSYNPQLHLLMFKDKNWTSVDVNFNFIKLGFGLGAVGTYDYM